MWYLVAIGFILLLVMLVIFSKKKVASVRLITDKQNSLGFPTNPVVENKTLIQQRHWKEQSEAEIKTTITYAFNTEIPQAFKEEPLTFIIPDNDLYLPEYISNPKIIPQKDYLTFNAKSTSNTRIALGKLKGTTCKLKIINYPQEPETQEKHWIYLDSQGDNLLFVRFIHPLEIVSVNLNTRSKIYLPASREFSLETIQDPIKAYYDNILFTSNELRGSSHGINIMDYEFLSSYKASFKKIWLVLTHICRYKYKNRKYYHNFVLLAQDRYTDKISLWKMGPIFRFNLHDIEQASSLSLNDDWTCVIGISVDENKSYFKKMNLLEILSSVLHD